MKAISEDLRERAVAAVVSEGWSRTRVGEVYGISAVSVGRYVSAYLAGESLAPRQGGGRPRKLRLAEHVEALRAQLEAEPDLDLAERCEHLAANEGVRVSVPTLWRAVRALGWTRKKKTLSASGQDPVERAAWRWQAAWLLSAPELVFVDESGANRALCPRCGYAPKGQRSCGQAPRNRGRNTSILAALSPRGLVATMTVEGSTHTEVFLTYLDQVLCPALRAAQTVIMDSLAVHKNEAVRARIEACGCRLVFLPAYSPDFNPIEHAFAKLEGYLRKAKARTQETLEAAIAAGLATVTAQDARGWFKHCGFPLPLHSS